MSTSRNAGFYTAKGNERFNWVIFLPQPGSQKINLLVQRTQDQLGEGMDDATESILH
jgi:hypothetical protein